METATTTTKMERMGAYYRITGKDVDAGCSALPPKTRMFFFDETTPAARMEKVKTQYGVFVDNGNYVKISIVRVKGSEKKVIHEFSEDRKMVALAHGWKVCEE